MDYSKMGFETKALHAGKKKDSLYGAHATPIYQTSTFVFDNCNQGAQRFKGEEQGFIYTRLGNPTTAMLEEKVAALENAQACVAFSSGMGAISSVLWTVCKAGAHVIADVMLYGCTFALLSHGMTRYGVEVSFVDCTDPEQVKAALKPNTVALYLETPANPTLKITDLQLVSSIAHDYNKDIKVICDNTFASPYLQRPIELGVDISLHSATKYLNGHGDVIAGFACGDAEMMAQVRMFGLKDMTGSVIGPFESFLVMRGIKTLALRVDRHCDSAEAVVDFLKNHEKIEKVYYPGLPEHEGHEIAKRQMSRFGGIIAFEVKGGRAAGEKLLNSLNLCVLAVSLGDVETLIEHPASMTHSTYSPEELVQGGISEGLVRMSVGLENVNDIIDDLRQGLSKI